MYPVYISCLYLYPLRTAGFNVHGTKTEDILHSSLLCLTAVKNLTLRPAAADRADLKQTNNG